jgi:hypothetical protein
LKRKRAPVHQGRNQTTEAMHLIGVALSDMVKSCESYQINK